MQYPEPKIRLVYDNEDYDVGMEAYDRNLGILLPDGRVLRVNGWLESYPPQPMGIKELDPLTLERSITAEAQIAPKNIVFEYQGKEYCASSRMLYSKYVVLPDYTVLDIKRLSHNPPTFDFLEVRQDMHINIKEEAQKGTVINAQLKPLIKENNFDFTKSAPINNILISEPETQDSVLFPPVSLPKEKPVAAIAEPAIDYTFNFENRVEPNIRFSFENKDYEVGMDAYDKNLGIQLPDGRVIRPRMWLESYPPQAAGLHVVENPDYSRIILAESKSIMINFPYEGKEYTTSDKINVAQYVQLPDDRTLQIIIRDPSNKEEPFYFIETIVDINAEKERGNIITAELAKPVNKLKM